MTNVGRQVYIGSTMKSIKSVPWKEENNALVYNGSAIKRIERVPWEAKIYIIV